MIKLIQKTSFLLLASLSILSSCGGGDDDCETCGCETCVDYDTQGMLENYADNLIIPVYSDLTNKIANLQTSVTTFESEVSTANLEAVRTDFISAYKAYQYCTPFDFGPAFGEYSLELLNVYPTNTEKIEANMTASDYDLNSGSNYDAVGFPAIDYLLYSHENADSTLSKFVENANRISLLSDLITQIQTKVVYVDDQWNTSYRSTFVAATGVDPSSSLPLFVNKYNEAYEAAKNFKVGIPSGRKSLVGSVFPEKVESYYGGYSKELLLEQIIGLENAFLGQGYTTNTNGLGLDDNLIAYDDQALVDTIHAKFSPAYAKLDEISSSIDNEINSNTDVVGELYDILQSNVVFLKSDLPSTLNVVITYQDGDGD